MMGWRPTIPKPTNPTRAGDQPGAAQSRDVPLNVVDADGRAMKQSRMGRRRAVVLGLVQLLIILHVVLWLLSREYGWFGGETITPIEPSESMEFSKNGVVNAGLIFFVLALLSTLVLGRWFCGWGCHVVLLQDLCLWILRKMNLRPRPFRSRLLLWAPLVLAVYMFIWPVFYRFVLAPFVQPDLQWAGFSLHLTTRDFWSTFPGLWVAIVFLFICGFATVYFLGAKGFCTYGCPYGGFFAPLDRYAPGSIRVTDDCGQCGHCTAACTSNVRVHEEVRTWGMVTDPGCMKTMDCIDTCPNDALYFGFGTSAAKTAPRSEPVEKKWDLTPREEWCFGLICLLVFLSFRGAYASIPLLMAIGIASIFTFLAWKAWRIARDEHVNLHRWRLKYRGRVRFPGFVMLTMAGFLAILTLQTGVVNWIGWNAQRMSRNVLGGQDPSVAPTEVQQARAGSILGWFDLVSGVDRGGIGLATDPNHDFEAARLLVYLGELDAARERLAPVVAGFPSDLGVRRFELQLLLPGADQEEVQSYLDTLEAEPHVVQLIRLDVIQWHLANGRQDLAESMARQSLQENAADLGAMKMLSVILLNGDEEQSEEGLVLVRRYLEEAPTDSYAWFTLGQALGGRGRLAEADAAVERALGLGENDPMLLVKAIGYYQATGRNAIAEQLVARLQSLQDRRR